MASVQPAGTPVQSIYSSLNVSRATPGSADTTQSQFLTLLTAQLRHQDPLNPMDNAQLTSQLAQISTVDGIERLNSTLQALVATTRESDTLDAASLVGHGVLVPGGQLILTDGVAIGGVDLAAAADAVRATVKDSNGIVVRSLDLGPLGAGSHSFQWDGTTDSGAVAANGTYTVEVRAVQGGDAVSASPLELAIVRSVVRNGQDVLLDLGTARGTVGLADVRQII